MGIIVVYKPTYNWGAPSCSCRLLFRCGPGDVPESGLRKQVVPATGMTQQWRYTKHMSTSTFGFCFLREQMV